LCARRPSCQLLIHSEHGLVYSQNFLLAKDRSLVQQGLYIDILEACSLGGGLLTLVGGEWKGASAARPCFAQT
jgi:hypothetical protein